MAGCAVGGLTQVPKALYPSARIGSTLAVLAGRFGFKPIVLDNMLAAKLVNLDASIDAYMRHISGDASAKEMEELLQLLHLLFATRVQPS